VAGGDSSPVRPCVHPIDDPLGPGPRGRNTAERRAHVRGRGAAGAGRVGARQQALARPGERRSLPARCAAHCGGTHGCTSRSVGSPGRSRQECLHLRPAESVDRIRRRVGGGRAVALWVRSPCPCPDLTEAFRWGMMQLVGRSRILAQSKTMGAQTFTGRGASFFLGTGGSFFLTNQRKGSPCPRNSMSET